MAGTREILQMTFALIIPVILCMTATVHAQSVSWDAHSVLEVSDNGHYQHRADGAPLLWFGGTDWWIYIHADRKAKDMTSVLTVTYPFAFSNKQSTIYPATATRRLREANTRPTSALSGSLRAGASSTMFSLPRNRHAHTGNFWGERYKDETHII